MDVEHATRLCSIRRSASRPSRIVASHHSPFAVPEDWKARLAACARPAHGRVKLVAGAADLPASLRIAALQAAQPPRRRGRLPDGPREPSGPRALRALRRVARLRAGEARDGRRARSAGGPLRDLRSRPAPPDRGALRHRRRQTSRNRSRRFSTTRSSDPAICPCCTCRCPSRTSTASRRRRSTSILPSAASPSRSPGSVAAAARRHGRRRTSCDRRRQHAVRERHRWRAENTDVDGVFDPLADHDTGEGRTAVILGAGGAARAAVVAARKLGLRGSRRAPAATRRPTRSRTSWVWTRSPGRTCAASEADLYLNATPVGSRPEDPLRRSRRRSRQPAARLRLRLPPRRVADLDDPRGAGGPLPDVDGLQMFAAQAVRQARLFGVADALVRRDRANPRGGASDEPARRREAALPREGEAGERRARGARVSLRLASRR